LLIEKGLAAEGDYLNFSLEFYGESGNIEKI
jgi:hypothetical protein